MWNSLFPRTDNLHRIRCHCRYFSSSPHPNTRSRWSEQHSAHCNCFAGTLCISDSIDMICLHPVCIHDRLIHSTNHLSNNFLHVQNKSLLDTQTNCSAFSLGRTRMMHYQHKQSIPTTAVSLSSDDYIRFVHKFHICDPSSNSCQHFHLSWASIRDTFSCLEKSDAMKNGRPKSG